MGLTQTAGIGGHEGIAAGIAAWFEIPKQLCGGAAACIPALEERGFVGIQQAAAAVTPPLAPHKGGGLEIPLHGARTDPHVLGNREHGPPLVVQGPDLLIHTLPARLALGGALLGRRGRVCRWHGHRDRPLGHRYRLLAPRGIDRVEHRAMGGEDLIQGFCQVLEEVKPVGDLDSRRCPLVSAIGVRLRPITGDDLHAGMLLEPVGQGLGGAIGEERHRPVALQINQDCAIGLAFPHGEIVDAEDRGTDEGRDWEPAEHAQEGATTDGHAQATAEPYARCPAQGDGDGGQPVEEALGPPSPGGCHTRQPLRKNAARTTAIGAEKLPDAQLQHDTVVSPREIGDGPPIAAMDMPRGKPAHRTVHPHLRGLYLECHLRGGSVHLPRLEMQSTSIRE